MIPILYDKYETEFETNGICRLIDCITCEATEERNGIYEVEFKYPVDGRHFDEIEIGRIIFASHDETGYPQPFDIYKRSAEIDGIVTFNASHVSYRLGSTILQPFTASTCIEAITKIPDNALDGTRFSFWTDKSVTANFKLQFPQNIRATLSGTTGSILDVYGTGEYEFDKWLVKLYLSRGNDTDITLRYGKNLVDITAESDDSGTYNAAIAYWHSSETGESVIVPTTFVAEGTESKVEQWTDESGTGLTDENGVAIEFDALQLSTYTIDLTEEFIEKPTVSQVETLARKKFASARPWEPDENISVDFIQLWQTEEYANVAPLERLKLCDTALIWYPEAGVTVRKKIVKVVYDALAERYLSMELGTPQATLSETIKGATQLATMTAATSMMQQAVGQATQKIIGGLGGYVVINMIGDRPAEILVLDTPDIASAVNVIRINNAGIGFSQDGYNGTYRTAWTIDGQFNADFITTGTLSANRIYGGIIHALNGGSAWNLETGAFLNVGRDSNVEITGGQFFIRGKTSDESYIGGDIRTVYDNESLTTGGVALVGLENSYCALDYYTDEGKAHTCFVANGGTYKGYSEDCIIADEARFTDAVHFNASIHFDYPDKSNNRVDMLYIRRALDYWSFMGVCAYLKSGFSIVAERSNGVLERVVSINASSTSAAFGHVHFSKNVEFGESEFFCAAAQSGYDHSHLKLATRQFIIDTDGSHNMMDSTTYGLRVIKGIYTDDKISCTTVTQRSDERLKNFIDWDERYDGLIDAMEPQLYTWKEGTDKSVHVGLSAQKLKKAIEDAGITDSGMVTEDEYLSIAYTEIPLLMMRKIKKQQETIETLEARIEALERKLEGLCGYMNYQSAR